MLFSMLKEDWETSRKARLSYPFICSMSCKEKKEKNNQNNNRPSDGDLARSPCGLPMDTGKYADRRGHCSVYQRTS